MPSVASPTPAPSTAPPGAWTLSPTPRERGPGGHCSARHVIQRTLHSRRIRIPGDVTSSIHRPRFETSSLARHRSMTWRATSVGARPYRERRRAGPTAPRNARPHSHPPNPRDGARGISARATQCAARARATNPMAATSRQRRLEAGQTLRPHAPEPPTPPSARGSTSHLARGFFSTRAHVRLARY